MKMIGLLIALKLAKIILAQKTGIKPVIPMLTPLSKHSWYPGNLFIISLN